MRKPSPGFVQNVECPGAYKQTLSLDWACGVLVDAALRACNMLDDAVSLMQSISLALQGAFLEEKLHEKEEALVDILVEKKSLGMLDLC